MPDFDVDYCLKNVGNNDHSTWRDTSGESILQYLVK